MSIPSFTTYLHIQSLREGVDDPGILKCVFMAGGPGSGKSYVVSQLFGFSPLQHASFSTYGLKLVNTDQAFETQLTRHGQDPKHLALYAQDPETWTRVMTVRDRSKALTRARQRGYEQGRLGLIVDGTGDDVEKIRTKMRHAQAYGYDCFMIFVNTSLDTALQRNRMRSRTLPDAMVRTIWTDVQANLGTFQRLFGANNLLIVDNSDGSESVRLMDTTIRHWMRRPISNPIGRRWIAAQGGQHRT